MKTDSLFYELFRQWPGVALDLAGLDPADAGRYAFRSEELKQTAFRLDGVLVPDPEGDDPYVFIEVQFQPDERLYPRLFAELTLYLHRLERPREWRVLVVYPNARVERIPVGYRGLVELPQVQRVDLSALGGQDRSTPGWELLRLIVDDAEAAVVRATRLIRGQPGAADLAYLNFIETVLVYQLPRCSREEIQSMLGLTDLDLKRTRFYQDVHAEGKLEGRREGQQLGEVLILRRQLTRRFGALPAWAEQRLERAEPAELECWAERVLDAERLEAVFGE